MGKIVTLDQLSTVLNRISEKVAERAKTGSTATFKSVILTGDDEDTVVELINVGGNLKPRKVDTTDPSQNNGGSTSAGTIISVNNEGSDLDVNTLICEGLALPGAVKDTYVVYALPGASSDVKALAVAASEFGGGTILTTRYRALEKVVINGHNGPVSAALSPFVYVCISNATLVILTAPDFDNGAINEYWVEIGFSDNASYAHSASFPSGIIWANGEPDYSDVAGRRMQVHIMNKIATYVII